MNYFYPLYLNIDDPYLIQLTRTYSQKNNSIDENLNNSF